MAETGVQIYELAPVAVNVTLLPAGMEIFDPALTDDGNGLTVTVKEEVVLHPTLLYPVTV